MNKIKLVHQLFCNEFQGPILDYYFISERVCVCVSVLSVCLVLWKWHYAKFYISFLNYMAFCYPLRIKNLATAVYYLPVERFKQQF